jgi:hypothetical protein
MSVLLCVYIFLLSNHTSFRWFTKRELPEAEAETAELSLKKRTCTAQPRKVVLTPNKQMSCPFKKTWKLHILRLVNTE